MRNRIARSIVLALCASSAMLATPLVLAETGASDANAVAAITKIENDLVKADLAADSSAYAKLLADDWTSGSSFGEWDTKQSALADMKDSKNNKTNSESISDLKVRVRGDVAIATYTTTYDSLRKGEHVTRTVISTDTFQRQNGTWKLLAGHSSQMAK
jgi:ketosteroid isomerase-like protein